MLGEVEGLVKGGGIGEDVRVQEAQQRVELVQVVLQGRPRQQQRVLAPTRTPQNTIKYKSQALLACAAARA